MSGEVFSNHIGGASELTVLASIKPTFVPCRLLVSYGARLRVHLRTLGELRRLGLEGPRAGVYTGPLDSLRTLQYIRWTLIDDDSRMLLAVNFDRPLEPYLRRIVDIAGPLLDTILCHCKEFEGYSSDQGFHKFMEFAKAHQAPVELFAAANPNLSVDDGDYFVQGDRDLRDAARRQTSDALDAMGQRLDPMLPDVTEQMFAELRLERPEERLRRNATENKLALLDQSLKVVQALYNNAHLFADAESENRDDLLYYRLLEKLTPGFWAGLLKVLPEEFRDTIKDPFNIEPDELLRINAELKATSLKVQQMIAATGDIGSLPAPVQVLSPVLNLLSRHQEALDWYAKMPEPRRRTPQKPPENYRTEVQDGLLTSENPTAAYDVGCLMMLRVDDPARGRAFLSAMDAELWGGHVRVNLSITHAGLKALRVQDKVRREFPVAFREGMAARAGMLGDVDVNNPSEWVWPRSNWISDHNGDLAPGPDEAVLPETIDIIVQLTRPHDAEVPEFSKTHPLFDDVARLLDYGDGGVALVAVEPMLRKFDGSKVRGHLGFLDGISQPRFEAPEAGDSSDHQVLNRERGEAEPDRTLIGDLLLGHPSKADLDYSRSFDTREQPEHIKPYPEYPTPPPRPTYRNTPLENGTFQVIRKLRVHTEEVMKLDPAVQEQMIGRKRSGEPLSEEASGLQDFDYTRDASGKTTPLQSHIRRTNPREADTPRILRRGFSYGPFDDPDADRGLMFIAYNANIAEQFEVIQRWVSGGNSTGIASYHGDPLLAPQRSDSTRTFRYFKDGKVAYVDLPKTPPVILQWGIYAFVPSRTGLKWLASNLTSDHALQVPAPPTKRLKSFSKNASRERWKLAIEDYDEERRPERLDIWREVRERGGAADATNYAVLVGSADGVRQVLENPDNAFSVREYWNRMLDSTGVIHLGLDPEPVETNSTNAYDRELDARYRIEVKPGDYARRSGPVNDFFRGKDPEILFGEAFAEARRLLANLPEEMRYLPGEEQATPENVGRNVIATRFFYDLIAELCVKWLGIPDGDAVGFQIGGAEDGVPHCPNDLVRASFYAFWLHPSKATKKDCLKRTPTFRDEVRRYVRSGASAPSGTLLSALLEAHPKPSAKQYQQIADMIVGVSSGFAGPTGGSFRFVMFDWIRTGMLWRLQQRIRHLGVAPTYDALRPFLEAPILESMAKRAAPEILHREVVKTTTIGNMKVEAGKRVVIGLRSAAEVAVAKDDTERTERQRFFLFGGNYDNTTKPQPVHACPGQTMALCTMMAAFAAIMTYGEIRPEGPLSFHVRDGDDEPSA